MDRWHLALVFSIALGLILFFAPAPSEASGCSANPYGCWGYNRHGGFASGWAGCDPSYACFCPLPYHDWSLAVNNCNGQVP